MISKQKISEILYKIDPMNLSGAPSDEYDSEAEVICRRVNSLPQEKQKDVEVITLIVGTVLEYCFENDIDLRRDTFPIIAEEIIKNY